VVKCVEYQKLMTHYKELVLIDNLYPVVYWDYEVMMPKKGAQQRADSLAQFSGILHKKLTDPIVGELINKIKKHKEFDSFSFIEKRNIELVERKYNKKTKLPLEFTKEYSKHQILATEKWKEAKTKNDFSIFRESLEKMVELKKQQANYFNPNQDPYDVSIDFYEKDFSRKLFDGIFAEVKKGLIPIIKACINSSSQPDMTVIHRNCPIDIQRKIVEDSVKLVHYDLEGGRIDESMHPFCTGYYDDVRITVKYIEQDFTEAFFGGMHESGHALYEQNYPLEYKYQPLGNFSSSAMHEGQARFIENVIGRSEEFWEFFFPRFRKLTGNIFDDVTLEAFIKAINHITPTKIRMQADPVTYSLHVIVRFEIEKDLFEEKVTVDELPSLWNQKMKEYLGVEIKNDSEGVLQDSHWAWGLMGYFPTYALGSYYNSQILNKMDKDLPTWREDLRKGKTIIIHDWLNTNIRNVGALYDPLDLIKKVTGEDFTAKHFIRRVKEKYSKYYQF